MEFKNVAITSALSLLLCQSALAVAGSECESNFTKSGSFFSGRQYQTVVHSAQVAKEVAYTKAYGAVVKGGYQIVNSDKDVGVISAAQAVSFSGGAKSAPLNLMVEALSEGGSQLTISFSTAGGLAASDKDVIKEFCRISKEVIGV